MSFGIWSSVIPIASLVAILAMGNPVALDASAEDLRTARLSLQLSLKVSLKHFIANSKTNNF